MTENVNNDKLKLTILSFEELTTFELYEFSGCGQPCLS